MRQWRTIFGVLALAVFLALVIAVQVRPTELERRHATIRPGMTADAVARIMEPDEIGSPYTFVIPNGWTWSWRLPRRFPVRDVELEVTFDGAGRVVGTGKRVNGVPQ
jgi:hypothetical protein